MKPNMNKKATYDYTRVLYRRLKNKLILTNFIKFCESGYAKDYQITKIVELHKARNAKELLQIEEIALNANAITDY